MILRLSGRGHRGSTTLWVVVFLVIFAVLLAASLQFITRQSHATIVQEQEEQAFAAAEAGLHHTLWLLNSGTATVASLSSTTIVNEPVTNSAGEVVARFSLTFSDVQPTSLTVTALGLDAVRADICQSVTGVISAAPAGGYVLSRWDHTITASCPAGSGPGGATVTTFPITLINQFIAKALSAGEPIHRYVFSGASGDQVRFKVRSTLFTPLITLRDPAGVVIASAGHEWRLAHVRYEAALFRWQENLLAAVGVPLTSLPSASCLSSIYVACIPRNIDDPNQWYTLPADGLYQLDLVSSNLTFGSYTLETEKR